MEHEGKNMSSMAVTACYLHTGMEHWVCSMGTGTGGLSFLGREILEVCSANPC